MGAWALGLLLGTQAGGAAPAHKLYVDPANGVTFSYPAGWLLNGDDDAATAKFRVTTAGQPSAVVQLEGNFAEGGPYVGSDFESGAFTYVVVGGRTEASCFAVVDNSSEGTQAPVTALWNGARARRLDATYTVAGTDDIHRMVAAYRGGRCYLFETSIVRRSAGDSGKAAPGGTLAISPGRVRRGTRIGSLRGKKLESRVPSLTQRVILGGRKITRCWNESGLGT